MTPPIASTPQPAEAIKRALITGFAYSGSTLLSLGLSRSPTVCALGEVPLARVREPELPCSCGVPFGACPIWSGFFATTPRRGAMLDGVLQLLERGLRQQEPEVRWLIDSGKTQHRGLSEHLEIARGELRVIHLVRHPAAVVYSCLWRGMELEEALELWIASEEFQREELRAAGVPSKLVCFEDMVTRFGSTLAELGRFLDVTGPHGEREEPWRWESADFGPRAHIMASNTSIKFGGRPPSVGPDLRFETALGPRVIQRIEQRTSHLWPLPAAPVIATDLRADSQTQHALR